MQQQRIIRGERKRIIDENQPMYLIRQGNLILKHHGFFGTAFYGYLSILVFETGPSSTSPLSFSPSLIPHPHPLFGLNVPRLLSLCMGECDPESVN